MCCTFSHLLAFSRHPPSKYLFFTHRWISSFTMDKEIQGFITALPNLQEKNRNVKDKTQKKGGKVNAKECRKRNLLFTWKKVRRESLDRRWKRERRREGKGKNRERRLERKNSRVFASVAIRYCLFKKKNIKKLFGSTVLMTEYNNNNNNNNT